MIAGIGSRRAIGAEAVLAAIDAALSVHGMRRDRLTAIAVLPQKAGEPGIAEAARRLGLPVRVVTLPEPVETLSRSDASVAATGQGSASEAAALAALGAGGRLLGPRIACGSVTCALAIGSEA